MRTFAQIINIFHALYSTRPSSTINLAEHMKFIPCGRSEIAHVPSGQKSTFGNILFLISTIRFQER